MPTYIMLVRLTTEAKRNAAEALKARDRIWSEFQRQGVKITSYTTLGPYDVVNVVESPSEELLLKFLMTVGAAGMSDSTTLRAFPSSETDRLRLG